MCVLQRTAEKETQKKNPSNFYTGRAVLKKKQNRQNPRVRQKTLSEEKHKACKKCEEVKPLPAFVKNKSCKDGYAGTCLDCHHEWARQYYQKNKDAIRKKHREYGRTHRAEAAKRVRRWRNENRDRLNVRRRELRTANIEKRREQDREYYRNNRDRILESGRRYRAKPESKRKMAAWNKEYRKKNAEQLKEYRQNYRSRQNELDRLRRKTDSNWQLKRTISNYIYQTLKGRKLGHHWEDLVGYTENNLRAHLESQFQDGMSWDNYGEWHIDHIIPISAFNFTKPEHIDFKRCWSLTNLRPLWAKENISKGAKLEKHFQPSLPLAV